MDDLLRDVLDELGITDWTVDNDCLRCPCDWLVEPDGHCPNGHRSPLLVAGLI